MMIKSFTDILAAMGYVISTERENFSWKFIMELLGTGLLIMTVFSYCREIHKKLELRKENEQLRKGIEQFTKEKEQLTRENAQLMRENEQLKKKNEQCTKENEQLKREIEKKKAQFKSA
ncbi:golgin subfamily A member 6-like protein 7 [Dama dama]|uniref:golgin subfamily A member 6-like protein 7 n=1 Tax=Dama dama TaxID=30532 RepID=UPI002A371300|nr:golgin subfamily A member 6-like protein 7 [Dama dama]